MKIETKQQIREKRREIEKELLDKFDALVEKYLAPTLNK